MNERVALHPATAMNSGHDARVLGAIALPGVAVALWQRTPDAAWQEWLDALSPDRLPRLRQTLRPQDAAAALHAACDAAGMADCDRRRALVDQITELTHHAARHMGALLVTLRVEVTNGQSCPKWHLDAVRARLLCTLRGAGTQFGPTNGPAQVARVQQMPTGAAALFRGRNWGAEPTGILHRSPPAIPGQTRLLVVVDPVDEAASC
ncbi:DUF1826 domain-containing protein [Paracoccus sp. Ld10]|uniref:DUF1826 domain-containing protein n=1 Tax=Paracoccus sp. Ld10 TaxID=649158 RepID=UPI00386FC37F